VRNTSYSPLAIKAGERVAQLLVLPFYLGDAVQVESLDDTERGTGGFGSTGS
jgi:dUTP pyrophosphatase